jgi:hypothetical protein
MPDELTPEDDDVGPLSSQPEPEPEPELWLWVRPLQSEPELMRLREAPDKPEEVVDAVLT